MATADGTLALVQPVPTAQKPPDAAAAHAAHASAIFLRAELAGRLPRRIRKFVEAHVFLKLTGKDAAISVGVQDGSAAQTAHVWKRRPDVAAYCEFLKKELDASEEMDYHWVRCRIRELILDKGTSAAVRLQALKFIGEEEGLGKEEGEGSKNEVITKVFIGVNVEKDV